MESIADMRVAAGIGMGSSNLDNELISDAFVIGSGWAAGFIVANLERWIEAPIPDDVRADLLVSAFQHTQSVLDSAPE